MINYNNCRWAKSDDLERMCLNLAVDLVSVDDEVCKKCSHFYSHNTLENINKIDEDTESLLNAE